MADFFLQTRELPWYVPLFIQTVIVLEATQRLRVRVPASARNFLVHLKNRKGSTLVIFWLCSTYFRKLLSVPGYCNWNACNWNVNTIVLTVTLTEKNMFQETELNFNNWNTSQFKKSFEVESPDTLAPSFACCVMDISGSCDIFVILNQFLNSSMRVSLISGFLFNHFFSKF